MEMKLSVLILRPPHVNFYGNEIISSYTRPPHVNFYGNEIISSYTPYLLFHLYPPLYKMYR